MVERFVEDGTIPGKGSDELEGYDWPPDRRHYGPGVRPKLSKEFLNPPGLPFFDVERAQRVAGAQPSHDVF